MNKRIKIVLQVVLAGFIVFFAVLLYLLNKPHRDVLDEEPCCKMRTEEIYTAFSDNTAKAEKKYCNKVILITGVIEEVIAEEGRLSLVLDGGVICDFDNRAIEQQRNMLDSLHKGNLVTLKCKCDGYDKILGVVFTRCFVIKQ